MGYVRHISQIGMMMAALTTVIPNMVAAQETANAELDKCVESEQTNATLKGAGIGLLGGLGLGGATSLFGGNKSSGVNAGGMAKGAVAGAAAGAVTGFAYAYFTANQTCYEKHPEWIKESNLARTKDFDRVRKENNYTPSQGVVVRANDLHVPEKARPGEKVDISADFIAMTPDGAELPVSTEYKLYTIDTNGQETAVPLPGYRPERHSLEPGEHHSVVSLPLPPNDKAGNRYRIEFMVGSGDRAAQPVSRTLTIV